MLRPPTRSISACDSLGERGEPHEATVDPVQFRAVVASALQQFHGHVGAAIVVDVLQTVPATGEALLRVRSFETNKNY